MLKRVLFALFAVTLLAGIGCRHRECRSDRYPVEYDDCRR